MGGSATLSRRKLLDVDAQGPAIRLILRSVRSPLSRAIAYSIMRGEARRRKVARQGSILFLEQRVSRHQSSAHPSCRRLLAAQTLPAWLMSPHSPRLASNPSSIYKESQRSTRCLGA